MDEAASSQAHSEPGVGGVISCPWRKSRNVRASKACPAVSTPQEFALQTHSASTRGGKLPGGVTPSDRAEGALLLQPPARFLEAGVRDLRGLWTFAPRLSSRSPFAHGFPGLTLTSELLSCHPLPLDSQIPAPSDALRSWEDTGRRVTGRQLYLSASR